MNKQQLAAKNWASANKMRSKIEANEYKDYILGFIFYKFLSDKEVAYLKTNGITGELRQKWICPLTESLGRMPGEVVSALAEHVGRLTAKYATTYQDIAQRINNAETKLFSLIGELQGGNADNIGLAEFRKTLNVK